MTENVDIAALRKDVDKCEPKAYFVLFAYEVRRLLDELETYRAAHEHDSIVYSHTPTDIAVLRELLKTADISLPVAYEDVDANGYYMGADFANLVSAAINALPALLDELEAYRKDWRKVGLSDYDSGDNVDFSHAPKGETD